jgi:hypothetical protein
MYWTFYSKHFFQELLGITPKKRHIFHDNPEKGTFLVKTPLGRIGTNIN